MSRHRAEPDDEELPPPPTTDTGPLMFGQGDWPPLRPPQTTPPRRFSAPSPDRSPTLARDTDASDAAHHVKSEIAYPVHRSPATPPTAEQRAPSRTSVSWLPLVHDVPVEHLPVEHLPVEHSPVGHSPVGHSPVEPLPAEESLAEEALVDEVLATDPHVDDPADELGLLAPAAVAEKGHRRGRGAPRTGRRRPVAVLLTLLLIGGLVTGIFYGGRAIIDLISGDPAADYSGQGSGTVEIEVPEGASTARIAEVLADSDVVASAEAFLNAASSNPEVMNIQPGVYQMHQQMSGQAAVDLILDPASRLFDRATIPEGYTVARTLESLADQTGIPLEDFQAAAAAPDQLGLPAWANGQLEGFLYPETYDIGPDTTAVDVLSEMVAQFNQVALESGLEANAAAVGLTPYEALTVASLVESEVTVERERPLVARVIYNRLNQSIPLGIDAALAYELGVDGNELTTEALQTDTPYNTRTHLGLPPTPISNPGQPSILGALQPALGDWIYYVLQNSDGEHLFTASYEEFLAAKAQCEAAGLGCG